uniref:7TM domain-containing protein n=1 Tax=uncultured Erythrobacter sp. TaxID=263913 RepID=UPI00260B56E0|nr:7TM domain-containing protein [uncultured Erythrobacter sp.]
MPSSFDGKATSDVVWGLKPSNLLMVLPLGAFLVVLARSFVGLKAFGLFTPMLIALAFLQIGPIMGPVVLGSSVLAGMLMTPHLLKLRMTRVGFLGVLIASIVLVLVALQMILDTELQVDAFPVIVCALVVERWWRQWEKDGAKEAAMQAFNTFMISLVIQFVMVSHIALMLIEWSPLLMPAFTAVAIAILGRYRGLRLTEIKRFAPIWLERRRAARELDEQLPDGIDEDRRVGAPDTRKSQTDDEMPEPSLGLPDHIPIDALERGPPHERDLAGIAPGSDTIQPNSGSQFAARFGASSKPPTNKTWVIGSAEDV